MEEKDEGTDLHIGGNLLDVHQLLNERKYYESYIESDVQYAGRIHSVYFLGFHAELLYPYLSGSIIADLGCGQLSYLSSFPEEKIKIFYGLDLSLESLAIARRNVKGRYPLTLVRHGIVNVPFSDNSVDLVISSEVLEHLDHPKEYLREAYRILKGGGYLSLSTPCASMYFYPYNLLWIMRKPVDWYQVVNCHNYWKKVLPRHPGLRPAILRKWVEEIGFSVERHETRLWYYHTPVRLVWRLFSAMEKAGLAFAGNLFSKYLDLTDRLLALHLPLIKWLGIRQFVLCRKN